jgi:hypothetical protein
MTWAKPKITREEVIDRRLKGLAMFDQACLKVGREAIIKKAIATHQDPGFKCIWAPKDCWGHFYWAFGQAWTEVIGEQDISATFNVDEALTPGEILEVRKVLGITEPMDFGWPRKGGIRQHHCERHDDPEKYAIR